MLLPEAMRDCAWNHPRWYYAKAGTRRQGAPVARLSGSLADRTEPVRMAPPEVSCTSSLAASLVMKYRIAIPSRSISRHATAPGPAGSERWVRSYDNLSFSGIAWLLTSFPDPCISRVARTRLEPDCRHASPGLRSRSFASGGNPGSPAISLFIFNDLARVCPCREYPHTAPPQLGARCQAIFVEKAICSCSVDEFRNVSNNAWAERSYTEA